MAEVRLRTTLTLCVEMPAFRDAWRLLAREIFSINSDEGSFAD